MAILSTFDSGAFILSLAVLVFYFVRTLWQRNIEKESDRLHFIIPVAYVLLYLCRSEVFSFYDDGSRMNFFFFELVPLLFILMFRFIKKEYLYVIAVVMAAITIIPTVLLFIFQLYIIGEGIARFVHL